MLQVEPLMLSLKSVQWSYYTARALVPVVIHLDKTEAVLFTVSLVDSCSSWPEFEQIVCPIHTYLNTYYKF